MKNQSVLTVMAAATATNQRELTAVLGILCIQVPQDRKSTFEPQIVKNVEAEK